RPTPTVSRWSARGSSKTAPTRRASSRPSSSAASACRAAATPSPGFAGKATTSGRSPTPAGPRAPSSAIRPRSPSTPVRDGREPNHERSEYAPRMRLRSLALVLALPLGGCAWLFPNDEGGDGGPPCEDDINGCDDNTSNFMEDPSCPLQGELELELGEGELEFSALAPGELPEIHSGLQGGQHVWMAVRVKNPDPDRKQLKIRIKADYCDANCEVVGNWTTDNLRELVADET